MARPRFAHLLVLCWLDDRGRAQFRVFDTPASLAAEARHQGAQVRACRTESSVRRMSAEWPALAAMQNRAQQQLRQHGVVYAVDGLASQPARWIAPDDLIGGAIRASGAPLEDPEIELMVLAVANSRDRAAKPFAFAWSEEDLEALGHDQRWASVLPSIRRRQAERGLWIHRREATDIRAQRETIDPSWEDESGILNHVEEIRATGMQQLESESFALSSRSKGKLATISNDDHVASYNIKLLTVLKSALGFYETNNVRVLARLGTTLAVVAKYLSIPLLDDWPVISAEVLEFPDPLRRHEDQRLWLENIGDVFGPRSRLEQKATLGIPLTPLELVQRQLFSQSERADKEKASALGRAAGVAESTARSTLLGKGPTTYDRLLYLAQEMGYEFQLVKRLDPDAPRA